MSGLTSRSAAKDRSTLYGVFVVLALIPSAFSVAFEYSARGVVSGDPWLWAAVTYVFLLATRFIQAAWLRRPAAGWVLTGVAIAAGGLFCWHLSGLFGFLGVPMVARFVVSVVLAVMYGMFGIVVGHRRARLGQGRHGVRGGFVERRQPVAR